MAATIILMVATGLATGGIYALFAFGFVLLLKATDTLSFAQFQFVTLGAYFTYYLTDREILPFYPAVVVGGLVVFALGVLLYYLVIKPMAGQPHFSIVVATIGVFIMIEPVIGIIWGYSDHNMPFPFREGPIALGFGVAVSNVHLIILSITLLFILAFILFFNKTLLGTQMRAVANDTEAAHMMGINVNKVYVISWGVAAFSASVGGVFLAGLQTVNGQLGDMALNALPVVILGGTDSIPGAIVGGLLIGVVEVLTGYFFGASFRTPIVFIILLLVLVFRPYGLFGERQVQRV